MPRKTPNSPALPTTMDAQRIRAAITPPAAVAPVMSRSAVPGLVGYVGRAVSAVSANSSGQFKVQEQAPGFLEDSQLELEAYTLTDIAAGQTVYLAWVATHTIGGGYWLALASSSSICFEPCDLFAVLDSLQLDSDAKGIVSKMKAGCDCSIDTVDCAWCATGKMPKNMRASISGFNVLPYSPLDFFTNPNGHRYDLESDKDDLEEFVNSIHFLEMPSCANFVGTAFPSLLGVTVSINFGPHHSGDYSTWRLFIAASSSSIQFGTSGQQIFSYTFYGEDLGDDCFSAYDMDVSSLYAAATFEYTGGPGVPYVNLDDIFIEIRPDAAAAALPVAFPVEPVPLTDYLNKTYFYDPDEVAAGLDLPLPSNPNNGDFVRVVFGGTIASGNPVVTALTFTGGDVHNPVTSADSGDSITLQYRAANAKWYVV